MASEPLRALQATVNRFAGVAGFSAIATDGGMGPQTATAVLKALGFVGGSAMAGKLTNNVRTAATTAITLIVRSDGAIDQTAIMQNVSGINSTLTEAANQLKLGAASTTTVVTTVPGGGGGTVTIPGPPVAPVGALTQVWNKVKLAPTWQKVAGGIAIAGLLMWAAGAGPKKRAGAR